jgi:tetratricopeptide (TPR) repeat protein
MTPSTAKLHGQPTLQELMRQFLASRSDAMTAVEHGETEVEPHEVGGGFRVDARVAWNDALAAISTEAYKPGAPVVPLPLDWAAVVDRLAAEYAVPMAAGSFPQRVRELHPLLTGVAPERLRPTGSHSAAVGFQGLRSWIASHSRTEPVLASGLARLIGDFETAERGIPSEICNERAALLWQRGCCEEALAMWRALPESATTLFNRGMALLFLGRAEEAATSLRKAANLLPEDSGWLALARLYLSVAELRA